MWCRLELGSEEDARGPFDGVDLSSSSSSLGGKSPGTHLHGVVNGFSWGLDGCLRNQTKAPNLSVTIRGDQY